MDQSNLPPAAKLAALIEAGRAANPDLKQGYGEFYTPEEHAACALGFACLGGGIARTNLRRLGANNYSGLTRVSGIELGRLMRRVERLNDSRATLDEIILSLREGELAKVEA